MGKGNGESRRRTPLEVVKPNNRIQSHRYIFYIIITVQMTIEKIKKVADQVILKGTNHKNEKCYYVYVGDKILDAIENLSGMLETTKLHINPDGSGVVIRIPFAIS